MAEIAKNEALVLKKTNFGDTSLIVQLYTAEHGKISAILKGARSPKSRIGSKVDILNHIEIVFYKKDENNLQLVTQANLISHFQHIKEDLDKIKYASSVCELILKLVPEHESNIKIFNGTIKILNLMNEIENNSKLLFTKYLLFFIKEIGFEISFTQCSNCGNKLDENLRNAFSYSDGNICKKCNKDKMLTFEFSKELFYLFKCLTTKNDNMTYNNKQLENIIFVLEKFLIYHNSEFSGIKSLQIL